MKQWISALLAHYRRTTTHLATFWRVTRLDGQTFGWVDHDQDRLVEALTYRSTLGMRPTATQSTIDLKPGTMDITSFLDVTTEEEIEAGIWDDATILVFEASWDVPPTTITAETVNILLYGKLGQITRQSGIFTAQLHGQLEQLDTRIGEVYSPTCPWRLGDSRCKVDLTPHTHTGSITGTGADGRFIFDDAASGQADGYYSEGVITMTSGRNAGITRDVRQWTGTTFYTHLPFPFQVAIGDTYTAIRGDDKRFETCRDVFNNLFYFRGFPDIPGQDQVLNNPLLLPLDPLGLPDGPPT